MIFARHCRLSSSVVSLVCACLVSAACSSSDKGELPLGGFAGAGGAAGGAPVGFAGSMSAAGTGGGSSGNGAIDTGAAGAMQPVAGAGPASVLQYHNHANRDGLYVDPAFTRAAAPMIKKDPGFNAPLKGPVYAQPLYFDNPEGNDLIITATEQNEVSAFDVVTGTPAWQRIIAPPGQPGCGGNIWPLGVTGTPVIDAGTRTLYVAAMTMGEKHQIFALSLKDGSTLPGWPVDVGTLKAGAVSFNSATQNQRGAALIVNNTLYVPYGGHFQDCGDYHGWVVGVPLDNPSAPIAFATKGFGAGIWAPGGLVSDGTSVLAATGNTMAEPGSINTTPSAWSHGNAVLRLSPDLKDIAESQTQDFFATQDWSAQDMDGLDLGSSAPVLFSLPGATPADLALVLGKSGGAYLLNRADLGGMGGELQLVAISEGGIAGGMIQATAVYPTPSGTFAVFRSSQRVMGCTAGAGNYGTLKFTPGSPPTMSVAWCSDGNGTGSPIVTSPDGMTDSVVWYFAGGRLAAFDGESGARLYVAPESLGYIDKYQTPIVAEGRLFIAATDAVHAFTLK
jgi:hypothetical protein